MPPHPGARRRGLRLATPVRLALAGACVLVLVVAVAGLAGGLDEVAATDDLPRVAVEEVFEGEPWNVSVVGAGLFVDASPARLQDEGNHWLMVIADIEITADESRTDLTQALAVSGIDRIGLRPGPSGPPRPDRVYLSRDATSLPLLHPGLPERVVFLWERSSGAPPPAEITVDIVGMTHRESSVDGTRQWLDPQPRAAVTVPLADRRDHQRAELAEQERAESESEP